jgi:hypothetical protein
MFLALSLVVPFTTGFLTLCLVWPAQRPWAFHLLFRACLAAGLGLGVASCDFYLWLILFGSAQPLYPLVEMAVLSSLAALLLWRLLRHRRVPAPDRPGDAEEMASFVRVLPWAFLALLALSLVNFGLLVGKSPHGLWDAWAIWNTRARFLFRGGTFWTDAFSPHTAHANYPLLLAATVARGWVYLDQDSTLYPALVGLVFTYASVGLLVASVALLRSPGQGYLAGMVLLGTAFFVEHGGAQYADVPLSFFILATMVLLTCHDRFTPGGSGLLVLAGLAAGLAAWTKNEGLLFLACVPLARLAVVPRLGWKAYAGQLLRIGLGVLPVGLVLVYFKTQHALANDLISGQDQESTLARLLDPARYQEIGSAFVTTLTASFSGPLLCLALLFLCLGIVDRRHNRASLAPCLLALGLMLAGYFLVYLVTPHDLRWHLTNSLDRLLLQLWPLTLFYFFSVTATPEEAWAEQAPPPGRPHRPGPQMAPPLDPGPRAST